MNNCRFYDEAYTDCMNADSDCYQCICPFNDGDIASLRCDCYVLDESIVSKEESEEESMSKPEAADILLRYVRKLVMTHPEGKLLDKVTDENGEFQQALEIAYKTLKGETNGN